jgi:hypothetical protein
VGFLAFELQILGRLFIGSGQNAPAALLTIYNLTACLVSDRAKDI